MDLSILMSRSGLEIGIGRAGLYVQVLDSNFQHMAEC